MLPRLLVLLAAALVTAAAPASAATVRVFAVGNEVRVEDAVSVQAFRDKMFALMDATFPGRAAFVQAGVDDVASHIQPADPTAPPLVLVNFPEDVGLVAIMLGSKGATARDSGSTTGAFISLLARYQNQIRYYRLKFGVPEIRGLMLAFTDVSYRAVYETYRDIAIAYGVWVSAGTNVAPARRIELADDPTLVARLRDPDEPGRTYAYEAVTGEVHNTTMIFRPDGQVIVSDGADGLLAAPSETGGTYSGSIDKSYLVPLEIGLLQLAPSPVRNLEVLNTPLGRLSAVISKDAWMVDVNERLDAKRANLLIQSEAFSAWAFSGSVDGPDVIKEGGFGAIQRYPNLLYNVMPTLVGNLLDVTFDGQSTVIGKRTNLAPGPLTATNAWVGQNPDSGFVTMSPWVIDDPALATPGLTLAQRRAQLTAVGDELLPDADTPCATTLTVGACSGGYREGIVWTDVELPDGAVLSPPDPGPRVPTAFGTSVQVNALEPAPAIQRHPRAAAVGGTLWVAWDDDRDGFENVYLARSTDGGAIFGGDVKVSDNPPGTVVELFPHVAASPRDGVVHVVWQEFESGRNDDAGRVKLARFGPDGSKLGPDVRVDTGGDGFGKWTPQVALDKRGNPAVVWVDERDPGPDGVQFEHVYFAASRDGGLTFGPSVRLDDVGVRPNVRIDPNARGLDNRWRPTIAVRGTQVVAAWADFRNYNWDVYLARFPMTKKRRPRNVRVDDFQQLERLNTDPTIALHPETGIAGVAWTDIRARQPDANVFFTRATKRSATKFEPSRQVDGSKAGFDPDVDTPTTQSHPSMAYAGERLCMAWQDDRDGTNDVRFAHSADGGATFSADERVDDAGTGPSAQTAPAVATDAAGGSRCWVVWEDTRNGNSDVFVASRVVP
jgi:hypothetical protein